jgi:hypothetical protein
VLCIKFRLQKSQLFLHQVCMSNVKQLSCWHGNITNRIIPNCV